MNVELRQDATQRGYSNLLKRNKTKDAAATFKYNELEKSLQGGVGSYKGKADGYDEYAKYLADLIALKPTDNLSNILTVLDVINAKIQDLEDKITKDINILPLK